MLIFNFIHRYKLPIKQEERNLFLYLFLFSFFLGVFVSFFFVPANSMFVKNFGMDYLPIAYILSGLLGYGLSFSYRFFQNRISHRNLYLTTLFFILIVALFFKIGSNLIDERTLSYILFVSANPLVSLSMIMTGNITLNFLNIQQIKRLYSLYNIGGISASILGYFLVSVLAKSIGHQLNLMYIASLGLVAAIVVIFLLFNKFGNILPKADSGKKTERSSSKMFFGNKYLTLLYISIIFSVSAVFITDFGFLATIKHQSNLFSGSEEITFFMSIIFCIMKIGELSLSLFSNRILAKEGQKFGLRILPTLSLVMLILISITGISAGSGTIIFLVFMTLNKSFERMVRKAIDEPSYNMLYQPLPSQEKNEAQATGGIILQVSIAISGLVLLLSNYILERFFNNNLGYYTLLFVPFSIVWLIIASRMYGLYKKRLKETLMEQTKTEIRNFSNRYIYSEDLITKGLKKMNKQSQRLSTAILAELNPTSIEPYARQLLSSKDNLIHKTILRNIDINWKIDFKEILYKNKSISSDKEVSLLIEQALERTGQIPDQHFSDHEIKALIFSNSNADKINALKWLYSNRCSNQDELISYLIDDSDSFIKRSAIELAWIRHSTTNLPKIVTLLESTEYSYTASYFIPYFGDSALNQLSTKFSESTQMDLHLKIINLYAKAGTEKAHRLLIEQLGYPNKEVRQKVVEALNYCKFSANEETKPVLKKFVIQSVGNLAWLLTALHEVDEEKNVLRYYQALDAEKDTAFEYLFGLLACLYPPAIVNLLKKNLNSENTVFAIEIIDNYIDKDLKQYIFPFFENLSDGQLIKRLSKLFPLPPMDLSDRLRETLKQPYYSISSWTLAQTIETITKQYKRKISKKILDSNQLNYKIIDWIPEEISRKLEKIKKSEIPDEVFLCMMHPDELVWTTAARTVYQDNPLLCLNFLSNINLERKNFVDHLAKTDELLIDKLIELKRNKLFFGLDELNLRKLLSVFTLSHIENGEIIELKDITEGFIVLNGEVCHENENQIRFTEGNIVIPNITCQTNTLIFKALSSTDVFRFERIQFYNLLLSDVRIAAKLMSD